MNVVKFDDLDLSQKVKNLSLKQISSCFPFYNDYYCAILLRAVYFPKREFRPIKIVDKQLLADLCLTHIEGWLRATKTIRRNSDFIVQYGMFVLPNGHYCLYLEKTHYFDSFSNTGITLIVCREELPILTYFQTVFMPDILANKGKRSG